LESKCHSIEERAKREASEYAQKKKSLEEDLLAHTKTVERRYKEETRRRNLEYHAARHELERIKQRGLDAKNFDQHSSVSNTGSKKKLRRRRNAISTGTHHNVLKY